MSKNIAVLLGPNFSDYQYLATADCLQLAGHHLIHIGSSRSDVVYGQQHTPVKLQDHLPSASIQGLDALVLFAMEDNDNISDFVQRFANAHKPIFSLAAAELLIGAKVAYGRRLTAAHHAQQSLQAAGAVYVDQAVVNDHNLYISSRDPAALGAFLQETLQVLNA
jgi:protease I